MTASAIALTITIGVLPVYGISMVIVDQLSKRLQFLQPWVVDRAAIVYLAFLVAGGALAIAAGLVPVEVISFNSWWRALLSLLLAPVAAMVPYLLELSLSSATKSDERASLASTIFIREADASVQALVERREVWWTVAIGTSLTEELLFRGAVLHAVWGEYGALPAVLASGVIFGLHHVAFGINAIIAKVAAGFLWSFLVLLGGSIITALVAHLFFQYLVWRRTQRVRSFHAV